MSSRTLSTLSTSLVVILLLGCSESSPTALEEAATAAEATAAPGLTLASAGKPLRAGVVRMPPFLDNVCGIDVMISIFAAGATFGPILTGGEPSKITGTVFKATFTAANGKSIQVQAAGRWKFTETTVSEDGTFTQLLSFIGLPEKLSMPRGPTLTRDAGVLVVEVLLRVEEDGSLTVLSEEVVRVAGPHPEADSDFALFCEIVTDALT